jgi:hypothetical protein
MKRAVPDELVAMLLHRLDECGHGVGCGSRRIACAAFVAWVLQRRQVADVA